MDSAPRSPFEQNEQSPNKKTPGKIYRKYMESKENKGSPTPPEKQLITDKDQQVNLNDNK